MSRSRPVRPLRRPLSASVAFALLFALTVPAFADGPAAPAAPPAAAPGKAKPEALSAPSKPGGPYIRTRRDDKGNPLAMETAVARFRPASGEGELVVDLVGVVHIGEAEYYKELERRFTEYDVVLYELVAPEGTRPGAGRGKRGGGGGGMNPIGGLQTAMKGILKLEFQLDRIDYTRPNFVHADMSPDQLSAAMRKRGETPFTLILKIFTESMKQQGKLAAKMKENPAAAREMEINPLFLLFDPDAALTLRRAMAAQFETIFSGGEGDGPAIGGETMHNLLIVDRNAAALKVFGRELAKGRKRIAIFYGAGHLPDFERRLKEDFDLVRDSEDWLPAWNLRDTKAEKPKGK